MELLRIPQASRGRPRNDEKHQRILATAFDLAQEQGYANVTIRAIALKSEVSRQTIYRRWPTKELLFLEVVHEQLLHSSVADLEHTTDLEEYLCRLFELARNRTGDILTGILAQTQGDSVLMTELQDIINRRRLLLERVIRHDSERRGYAYAVPIPVIAEILAASMWYRWIYKVKPLDDAFAHTLVVTVKKLRTT